MKECNVFAIYSGNDKSITSKLIRWRITPKGEPLFPYSHTALIIEPNQESINLDSLVTHSTFKGKGVHFTTLKVFLKESNLLATRLVISLWRLACLIHG